MDNQTNKNKEFDHSLGCNLDNESVTDALGYWFAALIMVVFLAAGVIVYRAGNTDVQTAFNDVPAAAQSDPIAPAPILPPR